MTAPQKRKLIEVALPLEAINRESAREKSIRHGHPSTLHLWWARRPLAACRAVLFAQLVDDPSSHPDRFPTEDDQARERQRLFALIERLVQWENASDPDLLQQAHAEIARCFDGQPPAILDPFAGGGSIPLEAQRLGLEAHASDLNPVAVLINKALIEIPPRRAGQPPVFPGAADERSGDVSSWPRATGLAEDVRRYGQWMRDQAFTRIGHLYPKATLGDGSEATVIAWIWARTVTCPNPACQATMPLISSLWLSEKKSRPTWLRPVVEGKQVRFKVATGKEGPPDPPKQGRGAKFACLVCGDVAGDEYIKQEGRAGRMGAQLLATVAEGDRQRVYLEATDDHIKAAEVDRPHDVPDAELADDPRNIWCANYGLTTFDRLFTNRQLVALTTLSDLVTEAREKIAADAASTGLSPDEATAYAPAAGTYLAFASHTANQHTSRCDPELDRPFHMRPAAAARTQLSGSWSTRCRRCRTPVQAARGSHRNSLAASSAGTATQAASRPSIGVTSPPTETAGCQAKRTSSATAPPGSASCARVASGPARTTSKPPTRSAKKKGAVVNWACSAPCVTVLVRTPAVEQVAAVPRTASTTRPGDVGQGAPA